MGTEVHVIYTGIVSFVPLSNGGVRMAMPNAKTHHGHPHFPHVIVEKHAKVSGSGLRKLEVFGDLTAYQLDDLEIDFRLDPGREVWVDDECILRLAKGEHDGAPNCGTIKSSYHGKHHNKVAAWAELSGGKLAASWVHPRRDWAFRDPAGKDTLVGHLAQEICHFFEIPGSTLSVSFRARDGFEVGRIELDKASADPIELRIGNTVEDDIFPDLGSGADPKEDKHVKIYYQLSSPPVAEADRSYLVTLDDSDSECEVKDHGHRLGGEAWLKRVFESHPGGDGGEYEPKAVGGLNCPPALWKPAP